MATNDIYQVKLQTVMNSEVANNTFYYRVQSGAGQAADLLNEFQTNVLSALQLIQPAQLTNTQIQVVNGMENADQSVEDISDIGEYASTPFATFIAVAFRRRSGGVGTRYSYKRFMAGGVSAITTFGEWTSAFRDLLDTVAVQLGTVQEGAEGLYAPCQITQGFQLGVDPIWRQDLVGNWQYAGGMSHQDTRQQYSWITATP